MRLRVIAGEFRSRLLKSVSGLETRPTPDRLREALFNVLTPVIEGAVFADAYAGTGAVGIEALSRGAKRAIFVERHRGAVEVIRDNLAALGIADRAEVFTGKATAVLERVSADIVFLDPPYALVPEYQECLALLGAKRGQTERFRGDWTIILKRFGARERSVCPRVWWLCSMRIGSRSTTNTAR